MTVNRAGEGSTHEVERGRLCPLSKTCETVAGIYVKPGSVYTTVNLTLVSKTYVLEKFNWFIEENTIEIPAAWAPQTSKDKTPSISNLMVPSVVPYAAVAVSPADWTSSDGWQTRNPTCTLRVRVSM